MLLLWLIHYSLTDTSSEETKLLLSTDNAHTMHTQCAHTLYCSAPEAGYSTEMELGRFIPVAPHAVRSHYFITWDWTLSQVWAWASKTSVSFRLWSMERPARYKSCPAKSTYFHNLTSQTLHREAIVRQLSKHRGGSRENHRKHL